MTTFNDSAGLESNNKPPEDDNRMLKIKKLKARLINEEHRLVLMKKIRQSQTRPIQPQASNSLSSTPNANQLQSGVPVKKLRPAQSGPMSLQKNLQSSSSSSSVQSGSSLNQTPAHAHQRPKVNTLWNPPQQARHPTPAGIAPPHVGNLSRQPITTPPNVVQAMMSNLTGQQSLLMNQINAAANSRRPQQSQHQSTSFNKSQAAQLLMQNNKRPNFKTSIQKQLEQTILQQQQQQQQQPLKHGQQLNLGNFTQNLNKGRSAGITSPHVGNLSRQPITTPPNVVQDMRGNLAGQQSLLMNANNLSSSSSRRPQNHSSSSSSTPSSSFNKSQSAQMLLSKRTAAKAAIQKQLEQTLMQLPQKHIQIGIDFLPNANNIEFIYYVGLEACVDYLTDSKHPLETQPLEKPFECSTCGTDFTPAWSWKRSNAVCENCVSNHVKKSIKNSQANRIKSVLTKAVKQEQDMEQRIMAEAANVVSTPSPTSSNSQKHSLLQPASHHQSQHQSMSQSRSNSQWPRVNVSSPLNSVNNNSRSTNVQPTINAPPPNPLANLQPAALASLLQMNPQLSTIASLMTGQNNNATNNNNNNNQFAQVAALLMNQLTMNLWKR